MSRYVRAEASLRAARHVWRIVPSAASSLLITHLGRAAGAETMAVSVQRSLGRKRAGDRLCPPSSLEMALARSDRLETVEASPRQRCYCLFRSEELNQAKVEAKRQLPYAASIDPRAVLTARWRRRLAGRHMQPAVALKPAGSAPARSPSAGLPPVLLRSSPATPPAHRISISGADPKAQRRVRFRTDNLCPTMEQGVSPGVSRVGALSRLSLLRQGNGGDAAAKPQAGGGSRSMFRLL
jgi:hypothetical protein